MRERESSVTCAPPVPSTRPVVLFACIHNSGRSVAAKILTEYLSSGRVDVRSAGSQPGSTVNPRVAEVLAEHGLSTSNEEPTLLTEELVGTADVVVTMGCGETCPYFPAKRYLDWEVDDPAGQDRASVTKIVVDIEERVRDLLADLGVEPLTNELVVSP